MGNDLNYIAAAGLIVAGVIMVTGLFLQTLAS